MEAIKIEVTGNIARVIEKPAKITSGTVGLPVEFTFDSQWEGLSKIAVFKAGHISRDMPVMDGATAVPMEVLAKPNVRLNIGVYGVNEAGSIAIPTIWENAGKIYAGAVPDGNIGADFGVAQKQYDEAVLAAEKADASAKKAESDASVAENAADRADAFAKFAADSAALAGEEAEYAITECTQLKNAAINARHYAEEAADRAETAADRAELIKETPEMYFDITDDGVISLKPEYRGAVPASSYPYAISDNGQGVAGSKNSELPEVIVIPEVVNEIAVTEFPVAMFAYNAAVKSITIPTFITEIPSRFARNAVNLHTINGTENVREIGAQAFYATRIKKAIFPNLEDTSEATSQFMYCPHLIFADVGNKITAISDKMFAYCEKLSGVHGGAKVASVGSQAFMRNKRLKNLRFLPNVKRIGDNGFRYCRINYDWASLTGCTFGTNATVLQYNPTDFWSTCNPTPCNTTLLSVFAQTDPRWMNDSICNVSGLTYGADGCNPTCGAMIYSVFENKELASPKEFVKVVKAVNPSFMDLNPRNSANLKQWLEAVGYTVTIKTPLSANLQAMYDALAAGAMVIMTVDGDAAAFDGGHAVVIHGVNEHGEVLVQDPSPNGVNAGVYDVPPYAMPIQNIAHAAAEFMIVTKN